MISVVEHAEILFALVLLNIGASYYFIKYTSINFFYYLFAILIYTTVRFFYDLLFSLLLFHFGLMHYKEVYIILPLDMG